MTPVSNEQYTGLVLQELRDLKNMIVPFMRDTGERLARLETKVDYITDPDEPSSLPAQAEKVADISKWRNRIAGGIAVVGFGVGWLVKLAYAK